jgi:hypothetical protein
MVNAENEDQKCSEIWDLYQSDTTLLQRQMTYQSDKTLLQRQMTYQSDKTLIQRQVTCISLTRLCYNVK